MQNFPMSAIPFFLLPSQLNEYWREFFKHYFLPAIQFCNFLDFASICLQFIPISSSFLPSLLDDFLHTKSPETFESKYFAWTPSLAILSSSLGRSSSFFLHILLSARITSNKGNTPERNFSKIHKAIHWTINYFLNNWSWQIFLHNVSRDHFGRFLDCLNSIVHEIDGQFCQQLSNDTKN